MNRVPITLLGLSLAGFLALAGIVLLVTAPRQERTAAAEVAQGAAALSVRVPGLRVTEEPQRDRIRVSGVVKAGRRATLRAEVEGTVVDLGAREHERVRAGGKIVQLDDTLHRAALERAEAAVLRTQAMHRLAQIELDRHESLFRRGIASASELDRARSEDRATFGALREARAQRAEANELLERTIVTAPFDGILTSLHLEVGDQARAGGEVGDLIDISEVKVEVGATDAQVIALHVGDPAEVEVSVRPGETVLGQVARVGSAIDERSRKFPVEVAVPNPNERLLPGMVAEVSVEVGDAHPAMRIPRQATIEEFGVAYVYVLETHGDEWVAARRRVVVRPVAFRPTEFEVSQGLQAGERIAAANLRQLQDGTRVVLEDPR